MKSLRKVLALLLCLGLFSVLAPAALAERNEITVSEEAEGLTTTEIKENDENSNEVEKSRKGYIHVFFDCNPQEAEIIVYDLNIGEVWDDNVVFKPSIITAETDGSYVLYPGRYMYDAVCDGYYNICGENFDLSAGDINEDYVIHVNLTLDLGLERSETFLAGEGVTKIDAPPYPNVNTSYTTSTPCGTVRFISQISSSQYFYSSYWGSWASQAGIECGTASISMALSYVGVNKTPNDILTPYSGTTYFCPPSGSWGGTQYLTPSFTTAMNDYLNGNGKYSPPIIHFPNGTLTSAGHYAVVIGKISSNKFYIADPAYNIGTITINGNNWNYKGASGSIDQVRQYYNANVTISDPTPTGSVMTVGAGRTIPDGDYIIATAADSNYFLDIVGEDLPAVNGANVSLYGPRNGEVPAYDVWTVKYIGDGGFYSIYQKGTTMSLDVDGASITAGGNIQVYTHHGDSCQQWSIIKNEDGSYRIRAKCSGFSLDYYDGVLAAGTNVVQWFDTDYGNQKWTFIPCTCTVTYDANGGTGAPESQTAEIGSTIILSTDIPSRASTTESYTVTLNANGGSVSQSSLSATHITSYSFKNWNTKAGGIGTSYNPGASYPANESTTLYAQWNFTIKYNSILLPVPTRTGYVFKGWGTSSNAISGVTGSYSPSGNVTLYAIWEEVKYTVSYDANGGIGAPEAQIVPAGTVAILSTVEPTREGYVFLGWTTSSTATAPQYLAGSSFTPGKDTTLFAVWEKGTLSEWSEIKPTGVDESFIETKIQYRHRDKEITTGEEASMDGWILDGSEQSWSEYGSWSEWQDNTIAQNESTRVETRTVYPYYYFYCTDCGTGARYPYWGSGLQCEICGHTGTRPLEANAIEWFENPWADSVMWGNDSAKYYQYINGEIWWNWTDGAPKTQYRYSTRDIETTYYFYRWTNWSQWSDIETTASETREIEMRTLYRYLTKDYTVTYNANGGFGAPSNQTKTHDIALTLSSAKPTRSNSSAGSYTVTLNANGSSVSPTSLNAARTTSYSFKNWNTAADGSGTSYASGASYTANADVTLYAQWNSNTTTSAVTLPTPARSGYTFKGWGTSSTASSGLTGSYTPSGNVTLYAIWKLNSFTVTYNANGGTNAPDAQSKTPGVALTLTTARPKYEDCLFLGWAESADATTAAYQPGGSFTKDADTTLYAVWLKPDFVLPAALTEIGEEAFMGGAFTYVKLPGNTDTIGKNAFANCPNLKYIYIPKNCLWIDRYAFTGVTGLTILGVDGSYAQTYASGKGYDFIAVP